MATNIRILHNFLTDAGGVTLTGATPTDATQYPVANVRDARIRKVTRLADESAAWLKFDFGAATQLKAWAFLHHNLTSAATVRLWGHTSNLGDTAGDWNGVATLVATFTHNNTGGGASGASFITAGLITSGAAASELPPRHLNGVAYFAQSFQWWFFHIADAANPAGYIELGRVVGGVYVEPTRFLLANYAADILDPGEEVQLEGVVQTMRRTQRRAHRYALGFRNIAAADLANHREMFLNVGNNQELLINPRPESDLNELIYGKLEGNMVVRKKVADYADIEWTVLEAA
ncbi:MAG: hypothetical protein HYY96_01210 [Candidatus Tectomicrobia bacterium]|nr:hypothetical protein [Candidatus Tectomicrobia bacterium]